MKSPIKIKGYNSNPEYKKTFWNSPLLKFNLFEFFVLLSFQFQFLVTFHFNVFQFEFSNRENKRNKQRTGNIKLNPFCVCYSAWFVYIVIISYLVFAFPLETFHEAKQQCTFLTIFTAINNSISLRFFNWKWIIFGYWRELAGNLNLELVFEIEMGGWFCVGMRYYQDNTILVSSGQSEDVLFHLWLSTQLFIRFNGISKMTDIL